MDQNSLASAPCFQGTRQEAVGADLCALRKDAPAFAAFALRLHALHPYNTRNSGKRNRVPWGGAAGGDPSHSGETARTCLGEAKVKEGQHGACRAERRGGVLTRTILLPTQSPGMPSLLVMLAVVGVTLFMVLVS